MCPLDVTMGKAMAYFEIFLPTYSAFECPDKTYRLWFDEFLGFWSACANNPTWEPALMGKTLLRLTSEFVNRILSQVCWPDWPSTMRVG